MYKKSLNFLLGMTLILGIYLMLVGETWFSVWLGLEINLMSFLPLLMLSPSHPSSSGLKYFLIQAVASLMIIQTSFSWTLSLPFYSSITLALAMKLGLAPFHFWLPTVVNGISWSMNMILLTIQKIGPLFLLTTLITFTPSIFVWLSLISAIVGALGGFNELVLRKLMAYSSISHMGWILMAMMVKPSLWVMYTVVYIISSLSLMALLNKFDISHLSQTMLKSESFFWTALLFLSLGGFPPFLGFAAKWSVAFGGISLSLLLTLMLIITSVVTLFFYLRSGLMLLTLAASRVKMKPIFLTSLSDNSLIMVNVLGGLAYIYIWSFTL